MFTPTRLKWLIQIEYDFRSKVNNIALRNQQILFERTIPEFDLSSGMAAVMAVEMAAFINPTTSNVLRPNL